MRDFIKTLYKLFENNKYKETIIKETNFLKFFFEKEKNDILSDLSFVLHNYNKFEFGNKRTKKIMEKISRKLIKQ